MSRYAARIGSALALLGALVFCAPAARADQHLVLQVDGKAITLGHIRAQGTARAIAADDPGLLALLNRIGATLTWQPGERYVLFTTGEPVVISFAVGDNGYDVGPVRQTAPFAPYLLDGHPYVPLDELIHSLEFAIKPNGSQLVLQPQLASIEVQSVAGGTRFVAHAGMPLDGRITSENANTIVLTFDGVGTTLQSGNLAASAPVQRMDVKTLGTVTHPQTQVTLSLVPGTTHGAPGTDDQRDFTVAFNGATGATPSAPGAPVQVAATPPPSPAATVAAPVQVTAVTTQPQTGAFIVRIETNGNTTYDWHRLRPPDNRFWLDVHSARLAIPPADQPGSAPVTAVRVHQENSDTVRIALSLADFDTIDVTPNATGITITVSGTVADDSAARTGSGTIGTAAVADWKFSPRPTDTPYVPANPRLIVIDPGHGGSDAGSIHGGMVEKVVALEIAKRLQQVLLSRGWEVIMTRTDDRDVYQPNDSASDELQTRDDVANTRGARVFVSVHLNAFINAGPHGATVYYYKPSDLPLAQAIDARIASEVNIKNDGLIKDKLYVVHHASMPATLIEAGFDSNPDDRALLADPQWQQKMAEAIADGIEDYAGTAPPASATNGQ